MYTLYKGFQIDTASVTESDEVKAFGFHPNVIQVSSNSWGPSDNGYTVKKPGIWSSEALKVGVTEVSTV